YTARDDGAHTSKPATVTLHVAGFNDVNNSFPIINSDGGDTTAIKLVAENTTAVTTVTSSGAAVTYSISGGADAAKFQIDDAMGALRFVTAPDFETPTDADHNNSYVVTVRASGSGGVFDQQTITVNVTDLNDGDKLSDQDSAPFGDFGHNG